MNQLSLAKFYKYIDRVFIGFCKVAIPRETGRSYGIRWRSGMRVTDGTKVVDGRKDERTEGWKGERTEGRTDGKTERIAQV